MEVEDTSTSISALDKPPNTPEMSALDAEAMANTMLCDSPLSNPERVNERVLEDGGSDKLPKEGEGEKLPEGGHDEQPEKNPASKLVTPCRKGIFLLLVM